MAGNGMHESYDRDEVKASSDRSFGFVFATVFTVVACWPALSGGGLRLWAVAPAIGFLAAAVMWPRGLHPLNRAWLAIGTRLHRIVSPIVMAVIFVFGVLPTALVMRMCRRDPLRIDARRRGRTSWVVRTPPGPSPESMKNLF